MTRRRVHGRAALLRVAPVAVAVLSAAVLVACSRGSDAPAPVAPAPEPEAAAEWASSLLDPCALLSPDVVDGVDGAGAPFATSPHSCGVDAPAGTTATATPAATPRSGGAEQRIVVRVGTAFDTADRAAAAPVTLAGLHAYLTRDVLSGLSAGAVPGSDDARCVVDVPISPTRSIEIDAPTRGSDPDLTSSCAGSTAVAEPALAKLAAPAGLARAAAPGDLGRWNACDLLEQALGWQADRSPYSSPDADRCTATPTATSGAGRAVQLRMTAGPATIGPPGQGESIVTLPAGDALQTSTPTQCTLTVLGEAGTDPDAPVDVAAQRLTVSQRVPDGDACTAATATLASIVAAIDKGPSGVPDAPSHLGFGPDTPDDVVPAACGVPDAAGTGPCRAPRQADVPQGASAVLQAATASGGADVSCAILRAVAGPLTGDLDVAAADGVGCVGLASDGYAVTLGFTDLAAQDYCTGSPAREDVTVNGRPGVRCNQGRGAFDLAVPALGAGTTSPGVLRVTGRLLPPRGDRTHTLPTDEDRLRDRTVAIAGAVVGSDLGS